MGMGGWIFSRIAHSCIHVCTFEMDEMSTLVLWKRIIEYFFAKFLKKKMKMQRSAEVDCLFKY